MTTCVGATHASPIRWIVLAAVLATPLSAFAQSLSEIRSEAQALGNQWRQQRGSANAAGESALVEQLGKLAIAFIGESDRVSQSGSEQQQRNTLRPVFDAIYEPLNGIYTERGERLDRMAKQVMDVDGDLDALYESKEFQGTQAVAGQALYYLNWLNYYGARLHDGARAKELLNAAEKGFSQFAVGERHSALIAESLLGRGLCHVELGNTEWAVRDFKLVIEHPDASPERRAKARVAMLDAYARAGNVNQTLAYSKELLGSAALDRRDANIVTFIRLQALLKAAKGAGGDAYRREAGSLMDQLRGAGGGWKDKVEALMLTQVDDPAKWAGKVDSPAAKWELAKMLLAKNDDKAAAPILQDIVKSDSAEAKPLQPEAHYWLGISTFKAGDYTAATTHFAAALRDPKASYAADASYWHFKSLEARIAKETDPAIEQQYSVAIESFLKTYPQHKQAYEARYRLGEYQQAKGEFANAMASYAQVTGEPSFELRASFGAVQSGFELLKSAPDEAARNVLLQQLGPELDRFDQRADAYIKAAKQGGDVPVKEFQAKVAILRAVHIALSGGDGNARIADVLADYSTRFPDAKDLQPQAARLRLDALRELGRFADAERDVKANSEVLRTEGRREALEKIATGYQKASARREADGDAAGAKAANQVALSLYEVIATLDGGGTDKTKLVLARLSESSDPDKADALYKELLNGAKGTALAATRGLARVAEARKRLPEAVGYWKQYVAATTPGDPPWYDGQAQQARLLFAQGDKAGSCKLLTDLRPAMPGLGDATIRTQLSDLYKQACE